MTVLAHRVGLPERGYNAHHFTTTLSVAGLRRSNQRLLVEAQRKEYITYYVAHFTYGKHGNLAYAA